MHKNSEIYAEVMSRGYTMRGMLHRPPDFSAAQRYPAVMLWHGFTGTRVEPHRLFVKTARRLATQGFIVARFDFVGSGDSDGDFVNVTPETEVEDALTTLSWIQGQPGVDRTRLGLIGLSLGGLVSVCTAARSGQIKALCLWAATAHMGQRMMDRQTPEREVSLAKHGYFDMAGSLVGREFLDVAQRIDPLSEAHNFQGRALVVHGSEDPVVPVVEAHEYVAALERCAPQVHIIGGADHTFSSFAWESELIDTTAGWLQKNL